MLELFGTFNNYRGDEGTSVSVYYSQYDGNMCKVRAEIPYDGGIKVLCCNLPEFEITYSELLDETDEEILSGIIKDNMPSILMESKELSKRIEKC